MLRLTRTASALLVLLMFTACTSRRPTPPPQPPPGLTRHVLPNGVRVLVERRAADDMVALQLWVQAGGRDEGPAELGLAHYLEHMVFKGTPSRPFGFIDRDVEGVGGRMNAGTSLDYTYYHLLLPARRALAGIEVLADISTNASLDEGQLKAEKRVVLEEMRLGEDTPTRLLFRQLYGALFDEHPYARPVIGRSELIQALTRDQLMRFYRNHYVPESFTVVVVGAVNPAEVLDTATRLFGHLPRSGVRRLPVSPVTTAQPKNVELARPGAQAYLGLAWLGSRLDHADTPALDLLTTILGQGRASRLTRSVRERLGLVNTISSDYSALQGAGVITLTAQLDPQNLARAEAEILNEVRRIREDGVGADELARALTREEAQREFRWETADGRAFTLGHAEAIWRLEDELAYMDRLRSVTPEQIRAAARRYLDPDRFARVLLRPAGGPR